MRWCRQGVPVYERLRVSPNCPLILPSHVALDRARERASGANAIGTTGRGIGPAYEDKVARRAVRVADLFQRDRFAARARRDARLPQLRAAALLRRRGRRLPADARRAASRRASGCGRWSTTSAKGCVQRCGPAGTCCSKVRRARCSTSTTAPIRSSPRRTRSRGRRPSAPASVRATSTTCSAS